MTLAEWLVTTQAWLSKAGITTARLDALILLEDALQKDRAHLLAHPETILTQAQINTLHKKVTQRAGHMPLAYIRGTAMFYGRYFTVNTHVLVPRPETETMITLLKALPLPEGVRIADIGTGSGCLAASAALEVPGSAVYGYDIDDQALAVARTNSARLHAAVTCQKADLLHGIAWPFTVLLANLPYVPDAYPINTAAAHEPRLALFAGEDGLDAYRVFWRQLTAQANKPPFVLTESLAIQHTQVARLAGTAGYRLQTSSGLIQLFVQP